jgi:HK97 family phage major capsid protein
MDAEVKKLLEEQGKAFEEFKKALADEAKTRTAEATAKVDALNAELTRLSKELKAVGDRAEAAETLAARPHRGGGAKSTPEVTEYKSRLFGYIRSGDEAGLRDLEKKALSAGVNPDGGYTVHPELDTMIDRVARSTIVMRKLATVRTITGRSFKKLVTTSGASAGGWGNEHTAPSESAGPSMQELEFTPGTLWAEPRATQELLEDSDTNIEAWLADEVGITFEEQENTGFLTGNGINRPRGILDYTKVANASYAWGSIGYIPSGAAGAFATPSSSVSPVDAFTDLMHALKPVYRANARWLMSDATVATVRKFKDGQGNLQWKPGQSVSEPYTELFLGKPIEYDDGMSAVASNSYSVAFADFKRAYLIVDRVGTTVTRDNLTSKPYVKFYTRRRVGGGVQNFEAIKLMKMASS